MSPDPASAKTAAAPGRPKDLGKGVAILDAAKRLFKETLFAAAAKAYCEQQLPSTLFEAHPEVPLRERLLQIARAFFAMVSAPEAVAGHRILCTPQMADSPIPRMFWEAGPKRVQDAFAGLLRARVAAGELAIDDFDRAASQFFTLLKGEPHAQLVFGCGCAGNGSVQAHLDASVDFFLRAYAPNR